MPYTIKSEDTKIEDFESITVKNILNDKSYEELSIAEVQLKGIQEFGLDKRSDIFYYVLEGQGKFFIENRIEEVRKGDLVHIPKNTKYKDEGNLKLLAISNPRFSSDNHISN